MDTVTEAEMAIEMALNGGIGIIHRFMTIEKQVEMVRRVKRFINYVIKNPYTLPDNADIPTLRREIEAKHNNSFLITNDKHELVGIVTQRDLQLITPATVSVSEIMTPRSKLHVARKETPYEDCLRILQEHRIEKLPLVDENWNIFGLVTIKDMIYRKKNLIKSSLDKNGNLLVGAAIGVKEAALERAGALIDAGVDVLVLDIAHGHSIMAFETIQNVKRKWPNIDIIGGNVATAEGTKYLIEAGADAVKVNIGAGSICTTRIMTGAGVPQWSAVVECAKEAKKYGIPIISDGGNCGKVGNMTKAFAAGASSIMLGNFLAGTDESPGQILVKDGKRVKMIRGMASLGATLSKNKAAAGTAEEVADAGDVSDIVPEGVEAYVNYKGRVKDILRQINGGVKSGMSYCGVDNIEDLHKVAEFIKITTAAQVESGSHHVNLI